MPSCSGLEITNSQFSSQFGVFKPKKEFHLNSGIRVYFSNSWPLLWGWASESRKDQCTSWSETRTLHCEIVLADISTRHPTVHMAFKIARANINYTLHNLANQFCYELWACWAGPAPTEMTRLFVRPFCRQSGSTESTQVDKNRLNQQFGPWRCTFPGRSTGGTVGEYDVRDSYAGLTRHLLLRVVCRRECRQLQSQIKLPRYWKHDVAREVEVGQQLAPFGNWNVLRMRNERTFCKMHEGIEGGHARCL